jgi:hypothetical protein
LTGRGWSEAPIVDPAASSSGAASAATTPHQGTPGPSFLPAVGGAGAALVSPAVLLTHLIRLPHRLLGGK